MNRINIFTYGSLMYPQVWTRVVMGRYEFTKATLAGYQRRKIKNDDYPVIFPTDKNHRLNGTVYLNLNHKDILRLDHFEGSYYQRTQTEVLTHDNLSLPCQTYILKPEYFHLISDQEWHEADFETNGLAQFSKKYFGFDLLKE